MEATRQFFLEQCVRYPALQPQDLLKALHQSVFGCGHFIADEAAARTLLEQELHAPGSAADPDLLDGHFCRIPLGYLQKHGLSPETLFRLFVLSAEEPTGSTELLQHKLNVLQALADEGLLPFFADKIRAAVAAWEQAGFPACRHSPEFRSAYHPAYRVIREEFLCLLPLLCAIDRKAARQGRVLLAIEGGSASGKTTLSQLLSRIYGCTVFHMDEFFLRPEQRTPERLAEPGGNVDRERF